MGERCESLMECEGCCVGEVGRETEEEGKGGAWGGKNKP